MIYQERLETNLLQLFAYTKNWERGHRCPYI